MDPQILLAHESFVRAVARSLLADESRAEDVVQDTWLAALRSPPDGGRGADDAGRLRSWLGRIARNFARQERRGSIRRDRRERATARRESIPSAAEIVEIEAARKRLVEAVLALEEPARSAVLLRFYRDLTPRAIARELGLPVETVRSRIKRGIHQLRERLGAGDGGVSFLRAAPFLAVARLPVAEVAAGSSGAATAVTTGALLMKTTTKVAALVLILIAGLAVLSPVLIEKLGEAGGNKESGGSPHRQAASPSGAASDAARTGKPTSVPNEPEAAETAGPSIRGIVVDGAGKPVSGAAVLAFPAGIDRAVAPSDATPDGPVRRTQSGADGRFILAVEAAASVLGVFAEAPGLSPAFVQDVRPSEDVTIRLDAARTITGFVRDLGARPVPGAKVTWLGLFDRARIERTGISAADGAYRIEGIPSLSVLRNYSYIYDPWIEVTADGFARLLVRFDDARRRSLEPSPSMDFYLTRGATLRGRVHDAETGVPIAGAPVALWMSQANMGFGGAHGSFESPWGYREIARTVSDEQGRYEIPRIPAETIPSPAIGQSDERGYAFGNIAAMPAGYVGAVGYVTLGAEGDVIELDVACWPAAVVEGRIVDPEGRPVAGATVGCLTTDVERRGGWFPPKYRDVLRGGATTDSAGRYRISGCAALRGQASPAKVDAFDPNYGKLAEGWNEPHPSAPVTVRAGETTKAPDLVMTPFQSLTIAVKDDRGRPVSGAIVTCPYAGTTGGDGTCRFPFGSTDVKRARGKPAEVIVSARGFAKAFALMPLPPPNSRFEVTLHEAREVRGRVIDSNGSPAAKVTVRAVNTGASEAARAAQRTAFEGRETADGKLVLYGSTHTWDTNTFTISGLPEGPYELIAIRHRQPVWGARRSEVSAVVPNVPTGAADVVIQLPPEEEAAQVEQTTPLDGSVVDAKTGEMLVRFEATLAKPGQGVASTKLAPGRFRFDAVPAGTWNLSVKAPGYADWEAHDLVFPAGPAGAAPVKAEMHHGVTVQGRVIAAGDLDLANLEIVFRREGGGSPKRCVAQKDGVYRIEDMPPGSYRVTTHWSRGSNSYTYLARDSTDFIVLKADEPIATRDLRFATGGHIWLRIQSPRLPKSDWDETATEDQVRVLKASRAEIRDMKDAVVWSGLAIDPGVDWFGVAPGDYRVRVTLPGAEPQEKPATVTAGEGTRVAFEFP